MNYYRFFFPVISHAEATYPYPFHGINSSLSQSTHWLHFPQLYCSHINSHKQVRGHRTSSSHSEVEEYPGENEHKQALYFITTLNSRPSCLAFMGGDGGSFVCYHNAEWPADVKRLSCAWQAVQKRLRLASALDTCSKRFRYVCQALCCAGERLSCT